MTDHEFTAEERAEFTRLPPPESSLSADDVLGVARRKPRGRAPLRYGLALAATALLVVGGVLASGGLGGDDGRPRGAVGRGAIHLQAVAEGTGGLRALAAGDHVAADERVLFRVQADRGGWLHLFEGDTPMGRAVAIGAGSYTPGGDKPQSWRPDHGAGSRSYRAWLCPDSGPPTADRCAVDPFSVVWDR